MNEENPGVDLYRDALYIIDSGSNPAKMREVVGKMAGLGQKLVQKRAVGLPAEEGYLPRGLLRDQVVKHTAARRLVDMLVAKLNGTAFESEMLPVAFEPLTVALNVPFSHDSGLGSSFLHAERLTITESTDTPNIFLKFSICFF